MRLSQILVMTLMAMENLKLVTCTNGNLASRLQRMECKPGLLHSAPSNPNLELMGLLPNTTNQT